MDWLWIVGGLWLGHYLVKKNPSILSFPTSPRTPTARSVRKAFKRNLAVIDRLPLSAEERESAREGARQKMLRDLEELMG